MENKILIPYAPILVESTRSIGYSFESALADIIDNSVSKDASKIDVFFDSVDNPILAVLDNGSGMSKSELEEAMRYGSQSSLQEREKDDLGRFGLGLKMASLSQCRTLTVISKKNNKTCAVRWDLDHIIQANDWSLIVFEKDEIKKIKYADKLADYDSGTLIIWENFDRLQQSSISIEKTFDEKIEVAREHISLAFHRFMSEEMGLKRIKIFFNNNELTPIDPFLVNNPATQPLSEQTIIIEGETIKVKPFILPYISKLSQKDKKQLGDINDLRQNQGFYVYRNKRLIIWGTWFKLIKNYELNKLARIRVDIPNSLDSIWEIDIKKSTASLPDSIKANLKNIVENTVGKSEKVYKYRGRKVNEDAIMHTWEVINDRGTYKYLINKDLPLFKELISTLNNDQLRYFLSFVDMIENSFPFEDIYYRMGKNEIDLKNKTLSEEEVYKIGIDLINAAKSQNMDIKTLLNSLQYMDNFSDYPEVVKKLKEDFDNE